MTKYRCFSRREAFHDLGPWLGARHHLAPGVHRFRPQLAPYLRGGTLARACSAGSLQRADGLPAGQFPRSARVARSPSSHYRATRTGVPEPVRRFDRWAASYDHSQLQTMLYSRVHETVLRYARRYVQHPGRILDVGCGTGRLVAGLLSGYYHARVVGVDASTGMIRNAGAVPCSGRARFAAAAAERLPFADAAFDLVVATLSVAHWCDQAAGLAEIRRVMAPGAVLVAADVSAGRRFQPLTAEPRQEVVALPRAAVVDRGQRPSCRAR
jgi:2-polyprenyl-3-methyl-5-hydroxy-6-metoxy-1,4-benzoquinol methylase